MEIVVLIFLAQGKLPEGRHKSFTSSLPRAEHSKYHPAPRDVTEHKPGQPHGPLTYLKAPQVTLTQAAESHWYSPLLAPQQTCSNHCASNRDSSCNSNPGGCSELSWGPANRSPMHCMETTALSDAESTLWCPVHNAGKLKLASECTSLSLPVYLNASISTDWNEKLSPTS